MNAIVGEGSKINWGKVLAGAAIATGAVLFGGVMVTNLPETVGTALEAIVEKIGEWFGSAASAKMPEISAATITAVKQIVGAGLIGGGVAYFMSGKGDHHYHEPAYTAANDQSFAMQEDMRKMQGLMVARAAAAGNPQAQAMLSQQMGRG